MSFHVLIGALGVGRINVRDDSGECLVIDRIDLFRSGNAFDI